MNKITDKILARDPFTHMLEYLRSIADIEGLIAYIEGPSRIDADAAGRCMGQVIDRLGKKLEPWQPTEQDYLECCGVWIHEKWPDDRHHTTPERLSGYYPSRKEFDRLHTINEWKKIEPIPEQCIPKPEPVVEYYNCPFPMLAGTDIEPHRRSAAALSLESHGWTINWGDGSEII